MNAPKGFTIERSFNKETQVATYHLSVDMSIDVSIVKIAEDDQRYLIETLNKATQQLALITTTRMENYK